MIKTNNTEILLRESSQRRFTNIEEFQVRFQKINETLPSLSVKQIQSRKFLERYIGTRGLHIAPLRLQFFRKRDC
jgi:hypothetical protein